MGSGADEGFDGAFADLFPRAFRLSNRILGNAAAAEDVAAEALARMYADWATVRDLGYREAWVLRVATNLALDVARRRPPPAVPDARLDVEETAVLRVTLIAALRSLPRRQRESIVLRHMAGLPEQDVAQALGLSLGTVKTHLTRGMAALRSRLGTEAALDA